MTSPEGSGSEIAPVVFTADYEGEPGARTFFLQAAAEESALTFLVEKEQVRVLAEKLRDLLVGTDPNDTITSALPARDPALALAVGSPPRWRIGSLALAHDPAADRTIVVCQELVAEEDPQPPESFRFVLRRDQVRSFVLHALAVVGEGREICQMCGLPKDPAGHDCPASNGHHVRA